MTSVEYTIIAYIIGLSLMLGYAAWLLYELTALPRRQRRMQKHRRS
jgi:hypothetical protein